MDSVFDSWGEYNRECTSAVAWWLHERNGFEMPFYDNANGWGHDASVRGFAVNGSPAVGSVAWWGPGNHVAWVIAVNGGTVTIDEYNHDLAGHYSQRTIPTGSPSGYIHFKDLAGAGGPPGEGAVVSHSGFVYRIAGGAPIYVSNWGAIGGPQPATPLSDGEFAALAQFPRDGTILDSSDGHVYVAAGGAPVYVSSWGAIGGPKAGVGIDQAAIYNAGAGVPWDHLRPFPADGTVLDSSSGRVFIAAGGAALYLSNWGAIGGPKPGVAIDQAAIDNAGAPTPWNHIRPYPADGTILDSSGGGVFIVAGGAPLYLSNWAAIGGPQPGVAIDQWDIDQAGSDPNAHLRRYPADGTLIGTSGDGRVYEIAGGAPLYVSNWAAIGGARPATSVDRWDVENTSNPAAHLREYPVDGTFINTSTGRVFRIAGGAPFYVSNWSVFGGVQSFVNVDQWDLDNTVDPHSHLRAAPLDGTVVKGLPSNQLWGFSAGLRSPALSTPLAVSVDDAGLASFPLRPAPASSARPSAAPKKTSQSRHKRHRSRRRHKHRRHRHVRVARHRLSTKESPYGRGTYFPQGQSPSDAVYRPQVLRVAGEGSFVVEKMHWSSWGRRVARGRGIGAQDDCVPDCATGTFHRAPARVRLWRPRSRCGNRIWTRMTLTWTEGAPQIDGQRGQRRTVWELGQFPCE